MNNDTPVAAERLGSPSAGGLSSDFATIQDTSIDAISQRVQSRDVAQTLGSDKSVLKIAVEGHLNFTKPAGALEYTAKYAHNLPYAPAFHAFLEGKDDSGNPTNYALPYHVYDSSNAGLQTLSITEAWTDSTYFYVRITCAGTYISGVSGGTAFTGPGLQAQQAVTRNVTFRLDQATAN